MAKIKWRRGKLKTTAQLSWTENGIQHRVSLGAITPEEAETTRLEKELQLRAGTSGQQIAPEYSEFCAEYMAWHKFEYPDSHNRIYQINRDHLQPHFNGTPLDQVTPLQIESYKHQRRQSQAKAETINKELRTLNAILNKAVEWQAIHVNPVAKMAKVKNTDSKPARFYTAPELENIYQFAPYNWHVWRFMANTGLRRTEMLNLEWNHVKDNTILVISTEKNRTKSGKWRPIPINQGAAMALKQFQRRRNKTDQRLITETPASLSRAFSRVLKRTSLETPRGSLHSLRHTFCSHLVMAGTDLTTVQKLAGHSTIRVTEQYAHLAPDHLAAATSILNI